MGMEFSWVGANESLQNIKEYFKSNGDKIYTLVSKDFDGYERKYIFEYIDCYYDDTWGCNQIVYKLMYPIDSGMYVSYMDNGDMCFEEDDYVRIADEYETKIYLKIKDDFEKYKEEKFCADNKLLKKYNLNTRMDLVGLIINKLRESKNITETLNEILK